MSQTPFGSSWAVPPQPEPSVLVYAGFWWRMLAFLIDCIIFSIIRHFLALVLQPALSFSYSLPGDTSNRMDIAWVPADNSTSYYSFVAPHVHWHGSGLFELLMLALPAIYCVAFESSRLQATPGKLICQMQVTDLRGWRITPARAVGRFAAKYLSAALCGIGFLMAGWNPRKRALHDFLAGTLVVRRGHSPRVQFAPGH